MSPKIRTGTLAVYKNSPVAVIAVDAKITIKSTDGEQRRVREKDVLVLHPGPVGDVSSFSEPPGDIETAWEMLAGGTITLRELCELAYEVYSPETAWAAWRHVVEGVLFTGEPGSILAIDRQAVEKKQSERRARLENEQNRAAFLERVRNGAILPEDRSLLGDVEAFARGLSNSSRTLRDLGAKESSERAHELLLRLGVWQPTENPHPSRFAIPPRSPVLAVPEANDNDGRLDLTDIVAYAIDDENTTAADDAVGLDGELLWVHIADPASVVEPESELDIEARRRASTLHAPNGVVHMLPEALIHRYSLGNSEKTPALSFCFEFEASGEPILKQITPSLVRVRRLSYEEADVALADGELSQIFRLVGEFARWRSSHAAPVIELPESRISIDEEGRIDIRPVYGGRSRQLVLEAMLVVGYGTGKYALANDLALPYSRQDPPDLDSVPSTLSEMWAARRRYKRSEHSTVPGAHAGLGLAVYVQATSPLRRYLDLLTHQQLRARLTGKPTRSRDELVSAMGQSDIRSAEVKRAEIYTNLHYTLGYLMQNEDWSGMGIVVARGSRTTKVVVPDLALEAELLGREEYDLDEEIAVSVDTIRLPTLECFLYPT